MENHNNQVDTSAAPAVAPAPPTPAPETAVQQAAKNELEAIRGGTHELSAAWQNSDPAAVKRVEDLWKIAAGEQRAEAKPGEHEGSTQERQPEGGGELTPAEIEAFKAQNERDKQIANEELTSRWGDPDSADFAKNKEEVGRVAATLFNRADPADEAVFQIFDAGVGNNPDCLDFLRTHVRPKLGNLLNSPPPSNLPALTPEQELQFAGKAVGYFLQGAPPRVVQAIVEAAGNDPAPIRWLAKWGQRLFTEADAPRNTLDARDAKAAERELLQFQNGTHALSEKWRAGDKSAKEHYENLLRRSTGGQ